MQFKKKKNLKRWFFLMNKFIYFYINSNSAVISEWSNKTSWVFPALKSTSHFLPQLTLSCRSNSDSAANSSCCNFICLIKLRLESSIISMYNNFTNNIIRKVINVWLEKIWTKTGTLRNSSSNWIVLWRLPIQIFCYFKSMTFLMLFVILISMLMMLHSTLSVNRLLIHGNN